MADALPTPPAEGLLDRRRSGIVLHPTSLPGPHGSGDFGPSALHFIDWLAAAGQSLWQVLPLNPIGPGNSPYASVSAFAGSPLLVALEPLCERGWLAIGDTPAFGAEQVDYERVGRWRMTKLREAADAFFADAAAANRRDFDAWCVAHAAWLDDYALFMALDEATRSASGFRAWPHWPAALARREPDALATARQRHRREFDFWRFVQWCFDWQWQALRRHARERGVAIVGDLPIFVAHHSADCWQRPELYQLEADFEPTVVAGVPPDYFSATGQRWGNPLYDWAAMQHDRFRWWIARLRRQLELADALRIDHFRGFAACWEIPAASATAVDGRWVEVPGDDLFTALQREFGHLPLIAEDLGVITDDVVALRRRFGLPGMRILQFAFGGDAHHAYLPHNYEAATCAYTGTHDNDTIAGWWHSAPPRTRAFAASYLGCGDSDVHWAAIRAVSQSVAALAIFPMQDVLGLGSEHRMNTPGEEGCWTWRFTWDQVGPHAAAKLAAISAACGRAPLTRLGLPDET